MPQKCSQVQKRSKYIGKTVHVTSVAQLQFCDATRILFLHKENKNNNLLNHSSPPSYVFWRVPKYVFDIISIFYVRGENAHERNLHIKRCLRLGESVRKRCDTL